MFALSSLDGAVTVFDPLTSKVICILCHRYYYKINFFDLFLIIAYSSFFFSSQRSRRTANRATQTQENTSAVNCIYSKDYRTVLNIGGQIKTWDFTPGSAITGKI